jgi:hypothetical protein
MRGAAINESQCFACGSVVLLIYLLFGFSLAERKTEQQKEDKVPPLYTSHI